jgi:acyl-CoA thioester hydrolase
VGVDGLDGDPTPRVRVELWVEEVRVAQFTIAYELFTGDLVASRARSVCVPFDLTRKAPRRLSEAERAFLAPYTR